MIEFERLETILDQHPELSDSSKIWLSNFALQLMPGFDPHQLITAEVLRDYLVARNFAPGPRLGAMVIAAVYMHGMPPLQRWAEVAGVVSEADSESLQRITYVCHHALSAYNLQRNDPRSATDDSATPAASLIAFILHVALELAADDEARRLIEEVFASDDPPPLESP